MLILNSLIIKVYIMHCQFIVEVEQDTIRRSLHQIKTPHTFFVSPLLSLSPHLMHSNCLPWSSIPKPQSFPLLVALRQTTLYPSLFDLSHLCNVLTCMFICVLRLKSFCVRQQLVIFVVGSNVTDTIQTHEVRGGRLRLILHKVVLIGASSVSSRLPFLNVEYI